MGRRYGLCMIFIVLGAILGGILGELLAGVSVLEGVIPYLVHTYPVLVMQPATIDLYVIRLTIGLGFTPNLMSILGIILALVLFRRY